MRYPEDNNRKKNRIPVILTVIVLILAVLMSAFLVLRCLSFDENGAHVNDRYGILAAEGSSSGLVDYSRYAEGSVPEPVEEEPADSGEQEEPEEQIEAPVNAPPDIRAVVVEPKDLTYDDDYLNQILSLKTQGIIDTVVVDLKDSDGYLSAQITTAALDVSPIQTVYSDEFPDAVAQLKTAGLRVIGRVYAFRDDMATRQNSDLSCWYESAGTNWLDADGRRWLDPTDPAAVQYLCDIVSKGVAIGCDEILLAQFAFPEGQTDLIAFDNAQDFSTVIQNDLQQITQAAGSVPVGLYLEKPAEDRTVVGQDLAALYDTVYRVVGPMTDPASENDAAAQTLRDSIAARTGNGDKVTPMYTNRDSWAASTGTAIFDSNEDIYQLFHLG